VDASGTVYIGDSLNNRIRAVTPSGMIVTIAGKGSFGDSGDGGPATSAQLNGPSGLALDSAGNIYFADSQNSRIKRLTPDHSNSTPSINTGGVISSSAFGAFSSIAPGSWIEIYGANLAAAARSWTTADFNGPNAPISLGGATVTIGGESAYLSYVSPTQLNVQVPLDLPPGPQVILVNSATAGVSSPYTVNVNALQPGIFAPVQFVIGGKAYAGALFSDGKTFALPTGAVSGIPSKPARPGDTLVIYGVGFGPVTPTVYAGEIARQATALIAPVRFFFGQAEASVAYAGLAPGSVGLYQFNVVVPNVAANAAVPLSFTLGGASGQQTLYVAVQN
jgi:uncharacterized protein (TIGR03437 family)